MMYLEFLINIYQISMSKKSMILLYPQVSFKLFFIFYLIFFFFLGRNGELLADKTWMNTKKPLPIPHVTLWSTWIISQNSISKKSSFVFVFLVYFLVQIRCINLINIFLKEISAGITPSNDAQKNHYIQCSIFTFLVQIKYKLDAHFGWDNITYFVHSKDNSSVSRQN